MTYRFKIGIREQNEAYTVSAMAELPENTPPQKVVEAVKSKVKEECNGIVWLIVNILNDISFAELNDLPWEELPNLEATVLYHNEDVCRDMFKNEQPEVTGAGQHKNTIETKKTPLVLLVAAQGDRDV